MSLNKKAPKEAVAALAYFRTSSAADVGADRDIHKRQADAIQRFAVYAGFAVVDTFYDAAVSGADPLETWPGLAAMLDRIAGNGVRLILVETASRFALDLLVQKLVYARLRDLGITLIAADSPHSFVDDTPTSVLIPLCLFAIGLGWYMWPVPPDALALSAVAALFGSLLVVLLWE
jgi:hypothetical protein